MDTLYTSYVILKLKSLLFHYFPKVLGHSLAVFLCIAYIRKDLSQCFFIIFCDKLFILRQRLLIGIQTVDILRSIKGLKKNLLLNLNKICYKIG